MCGEALALFPLLTGSSLIQKLVTRVVPEKKVLHQWDLMTALIELLNLNLVLNLSIGDGRESSHHYYFDLTALEPFGCWSWLLTVVGTITDEKETVFWRCSAVLSGGKWQTWDDNTQAKSLSEIHDRWETEVPRCLSFPVNMELTLSKIKLNMEVYRMVCISEISPMSLL